VECSALSFTKPQNRNEGADVLVMSRIWNDSLRSRVIQSRTRLRRSGGNYSCSLAT
jgi:hypothetical protein